MDESAARPARSETSPHRRPMQHRDLRRDRRSVPQEAASRHLRSGQPRPAAAELRPDRVRTPRLDRGPFQGFRQGERAGALPHAVQGIDLEAARLRHPLRAGNLRRPQGVRTPVRHRGRTRPRPRYPRQPRVLHVRTAARLPAGLPPAGRLRPGEILRGCLASRHHRKTVRP